LNLFNVITLQTERLNLIPFTKEDQDEVYQVFTDSYVRKYLWDDEIIDLSIVEELMIANENHFTKDKWGIWKIVSLQDNAFMGFAGFWLFFDEVQPQLVAGLFEPFTGQGYANEASQAVIEYAFKELNFTSITAAMDAPNADSIRMVRNLGMKFKESKIIDNAPTLFYELQQ